MTWLLCALGFHKWHWFGPPEFDDAFCQCVRCGKENLNMEQTVMDKSLQILRSMRSQLAMYDFLLPCDYWKTIEPPMVRQGLFARKRPLPITPAIEIWAGEVARARSLMDLDCAIQQIEEAQ